MTLNAFRLPNPDFKKLAYILLQEAPEGAGEGELIRCAVRRWDELGDTKIGEIVSLAERLQEEREMPPGMQVTPEAKAALHSWILKLLKSDIEVNVEDAYKLAKEAGVCPYVLQTFRTGHFYPLRKMLRVERGLPAKGRSRPRLELNTTPISEVDAQPKGRVPKTMRGLTAEEIQEEDGEALQEETPISEVEPKGEIPDDHPALQKAQEEDQVILMPEHSIGEGSGVAAEGTGPFFPEFDRDKHTTERDIEAEEAGLEPHGDGSFIEMQRMAFPRGGTKPTPVIPIEGHCNLTIRSPMGEARYTLSASGAADIYLRSPNVYSLLILMRFVDGMLPALTGTAEEEYPLLPNLVSPLEGEEEKAED